MPVAAGDQKVSGSSTEFWTSLAGVGFEGTADGGGGFLPTDVMGFGTPSTLHPPPSTLHPEVCVRASVGGCVREDGHHPILELARGRRILRRPG